jgi:hypothetical protein
MSIALVVFIVCECAESDIEECGMEEQCDDKDTGFTAGRGSLV